MLNLSKLPINIFQSNISVLFVFFLVSAQMAFSQNEEKFDINVYGFAKLNATFDFKDIGGSDLFKPSSIPVPTPSDENQDFFMSARQSRIGILSTIPVMGITVTAKIEGDFHDSGTNTTNLFRLRHAYVQFKNWTVGQTWSTFFDIETNPSSVDFEGPNSSTLNRVPMIRYTNDISKSTQLNIAIENPTEQVTTTGALQPANQRFPDVAANMKLFRGNGGHLMIAGVVTELRYTDSMGDFQGESGFGGLLTGTVKTNEENNLKFQIAAGKGIAHFVEGVRGLGYDAVTDTSNDKLETLLVIGSFLAYQHYWSKSVFSSIIVGDVRLEKSDLLAANDFYSGTYFGLNLFWSPIAHVSFGIEYLFGLRENQDGENGNTSRIQFGGQLAFK